MRKTACIGLIAVAGLAACAADETGPPADTPGTTVVLSEPSTVPAPDPADLSRFVAGDRSPVFTERTELVIAESFPIQVFVAVSGNLPTPCHALGWDVAIDAPNIKVQLYSVADPDTMCIQVLEPFDVSIPLGSYADGTWSVLLDGEPVGDFAP
ncbi:MAG: hypothetical protein OEO77_11770 [Acidimicrobiia bacterium]|nr:hypothetical protein [Acidimicrobiia bacterium]